MLLFERAALADLNFHRFFIELSRNTRLIKFWDSIYAQSRYILHNLYYVQTHQADEAAEYGEHSKLISAIRSGDQEQIYQTLSDHMEYAISTLKRLWSMITT